MENLRDFFYNDFCQCPFLRSKKNIIGSFCLIMGQFPFKDSIEYERWLVKGYRIKIFYYDGYRDYFD